MSCGGGGHRVSSASSSLHVKYTHKMVVVVVTRVTSTRLVGCICRVGLMS